MTQHADPPFGAQPARFGRQPKLSQGEEKLRCPAKSAYAFAQKRLHLLWRHLT